MGRSQKVSWILSCVLFFGVLGGFFFWFLLSPDQEISQGERRKLQQLPSFSTQRLFSGAYFRDLDQYALDQFPLRDSFRTAKALFSYDVLRRTDNNGLYWDGDFLCKLDYPLREDQVLLGAKKVNTLRDSYFPDSPCFIAIVPDKNYYSALPLGYPALDYGRMETLLKENLPDCTFIDLFSVLSLEDYYRTDTHWRQERLEKVVNALSQAMGFSSPAFSQYEAQTIPDFLGVYAGQSAYPVEGEALTYLTSPLIQEAQVFNKELEEYQAVYQPEKFTGNDPYDLFLTGASPLLTITTGAQTEKKLILFRDSFGSSLAPLLLSSYSEITLVDLRYLSTALLPEVLDFQGRDVLFLYSTGIWNNSALLR